MKEYRALEAKGEKAGCREDEQGGAGTPPGLTEIGEVSGWWWWKQRDSGPAPGLHHV